MDKIVLLYSRARMFETDSNEQSIRENGFTFVELSIVMVLIGILIAGIMLGTAIVEQAEIRSVITDIKRNQDAFNLFVNKYRSMPGDMPDATTVLAGPNLFNGNGGRQITWDASDTCFDGNTPPNRVVCSEGAQAWYHMALAGMVPGTFNPVLDGNNTAILGTNIPSSRITGAGYSIDYDSTAGGTSNHLLFGAQNPTGPNNGPAISSSDALVIDQKTDDGIPNTGRVQDAALAGAGCSIAVSGNPNQYNTAAGSGPACALNIQLDYSN